MVINVKNALKNEGELFPICEDFSFTPEDFQGKVVSVRCMLTRNTAASAAI
ncbi:MAG: hypothetical protein L6V89_08955 [Oscillospiraceae bacterium]|nr:MAG: hypothetical protein L6V89_08955 [Oscillospiraceae bacterium]